MQSLTIENGVKKFRSPEYNYNFRLSDGYFERWGKNFEEDPTHSEFGPEILDIEVSTICNMGCPFCYKSNTACGSNMSFETFKQILDTFPKYNGHHFLTQIAFGIGDIDSCPDLWAMMEYTRSQGIIPNITINGANLDDETAERLVKTCGAISVSRYEDPNICYDAIDKLIGLGCKQVNIHQMVSDETYRKCIEVLKDYGTDPRLKNLNAIVFLALKQKGRGEHHTPLPYKSFKSLIEYAVDNSVPIGFDSCGCNKVLEVAKELGRYEQWLPYAEPCESCSFSSYIDEKGVFFPCSFAAECTKGTDVKSVTDFMDVWYNDNTVMERNRIQDNNRDCPYFEV